MRIDKKVNQITISGIKGNINIVGHNKDIFEVKIDKEELVNVKGLKCDNPEYDYVDNDIPFEDYPNWIDQPYPKCGSNLLTQQDYDATVFLFEKAKILKEIPIPVDPNIPLVKMKAYFNGSGNVDFEICPSNEE